MFRRALSSVRSLRAVLAAAVVMTGAWSTSAQAAVYTGVWDPPYGAPFGTLTTGLGWRGTAEFFVPDTCVPAGDAVVINPLPAILGGCGGAATVTNAQVELYDVAQAGTPTLATLVFNPASFYVGLLQYDGGELEGLLTDFSNLLTTSLAPMFGITSSTQFSLIFTLDGPRLAWVDCGYGGDYGDSERSSYSTSTHGHGCRGGINSDAPGYQPEFTISRVPEPGTLALACLGLLAAAPRVRKLMQRR